MSLRLGLRPWLGLSMRPTTAPAPVLSSTPATAQVPASVSTKYQIPAPAPASILILAPIPTLALSRTLAQAPHPDGTPGSSSMPDNACYLSLVWLLFCPLHGIFKGYPWATHKPPIGYRPRGYPSAAHGLPPNPHWLPMVYPWPTHGLPMTYSLDVHRPSVPWVSHELPKVGLRASYG